MNNNRNLWLLILSLGISSGTLLINRFVSTIPDWLAIILAVVSFILLVAFFITSKKYKNKI